MRPLASRPVAWICPSCFGQIRDVGPGRRDGESLDALQGRRIADTAATWTRVGETLASSAPADAGLVVADVSEPGVLRRLLRVDNCFCGTEIEGHSIFLPATQRVSIWSAAEFRLVVGAIARSCAARSRLARLPPMTRLCLARVRLRFVVAGRPLDVATEAALKADGRTGARSILAAVARRRFENRSEGQRLRKMLRYEGSLWSAGARYVAGVDEAGMSPLAGPVAAAAVILTPGTRIEGVDDSKKLDTASRERLAVEIKASAVAWSVAFAEVDEIDSINIYSASRLAMRRAIDGLPQPPDHVLVDGRRLKGLELPQQEIIKGDAKSLTIAAASILAKTARDELMCRLDSLISRIWLCEAQGLSGP